jgi:hypothetical protein
MVAAFFKLMLSADSDFSGRVTSAASSKVFIRQKRLVLVFVLAR